MTKKAVAEIQGLLHRESLAESISNMWDQHNMNRRKWLDDKLELRNYIFAIDTTTTTNSKLPWKNKTTLPKLCQIRDNLHANYLSALFPNDDWLKWEGHSQESSVLEKRRAIEAYMKNKVRESNLRTTVSQLLYDYIDYGNVFYDIEYVREVHEDPETGEQIPGYIGPKGVRISPMDLVFNPLAADFDSTYKITRSIKTMGELQDDIDNRPEMLYYDSVVENAKQYRRSLSAYSQEDFRKAQAFMVDGFGSLYDYFQSNYVEVLEFEGSLHDSEGTYHKNVLITVIDRCHVIRNVPMPSWLGKSYKGHTGWRGRPDNLYAMGPLDNLVGMQYRIDHLENLKADAMDLGVFPPVVIAGNVEEFEWGPGVEIIAGEGASITELGKNIQWVLGAANDIAAMEAKMEEMAGAPKQAMGIRTPGEKTAFEVQTLEMAASRIFQNKIQNFEINVLEPMLNKMLEIARRNLDGADVIRVMDDDVGVVNFLSISKADITASGKLRPIGARHFAAQATLVQNFMGFMSSPVGQDDAVRVHISGKAIAKAMEELLGVEKFQIYQANARVFELQETQSLMNTASEDNEVAAATPIEPPPVEGEL
jgi:hypothetical protein